MFGKLVFCTRFPGFESHRYLKENYQSNTRQIFNSELDLVFCKGFRGATQTGSQVVERLVNGRQGKDEGEVLNPIEFTTLHYGADSPGS